MAPTIFPVYKPQGKTSSDIVYHFKRNLPQGFGKIGHLGTLDPFAQGLLLIAVAGAARAGDYLHEYAPKTYRARGVVGVKTPSGDNTLEAIHQEDPPEILDKTEIKDLEFLLRETFLGEYWQNVPAFSATKHEGRPLYE
jgi:tRNA pseudouridine55 synthase